VYKCLHGTGLANLADELIQSSYFESCRRLGWSSSLYLIVPRTRLSTHRLVTVRFVNRADADADDPYLWSRRPHVTSAPPVNILKTRLKTCLFPRSVP